MLVYFREEAEWEHQRESYWNGVQRAFESGGWGKTEDILSSLQDDLFESGEAEERAIGNVRIRACMSDNEK